MTNSLKTTLVEDFGQLKALFVGINKYSDSIPLSYCVQDAESLAGILSNSQHSMSGKKTIRLMTDKSEELDKPIRNNIFNNILSLSKAAQPTDTILFFFAGHGTEIDNEGFILPSDFRQVTGARGAISIKEIKEEFKRSKARFKVLLFDACHSGSIRGRAESGRMTEVLFKSLFPVPKGFAVVSSCNQDEFSFEWAEKGHGVFSYYMLEGLEGHADENHDGFVDLSELHHYLTPRVQEWALDNGKVQTPVIEANFSGLLPLTKSAETKAPKTTTATYGNVSWISLATDTEKINFRDYESGLDEPIEELLRGDMNRVNAALLRDFKPSELIEKGDRVDFPVGYMELVTEEKEILGVVRFWVRICFDCSSQGRELSEKILARLDSFTKLWYKLSFRMEKCRYDMDKLKQICDEKGYGVEKFQTKLPQKLIARVNNWTSEQLILTFVNDENAIVDIKSTSGPLPDNFYSVLNPKNFLGIFGPTIISK